MQHSVPRLSSAQLLPIPPWRAQSLQHRLRPQAAINSRRAPTSPGPRRRRHLQPTCGMAEVLLPGLLADAALTLGSAPRSTRSSEDTWCLEEAESDLQLDCAKEQGRRHMRQLSLFTFKRWAFHRSTARYARHMSGILQSRIVRGLAPPILSAGAAAAAVCAYEEARRQGWLPAGLPSLILPPLPFDITSFALSLLLVFRTNSSYQRWDEARKMWGSMVNRSRDFTRQALGYVPESQPELRSMLVRWSITYPRALMCHLRPGENIEEEVKDILKPEEVKALVASTHRPNYCMQVLTACLKEAQLPAAVTSNTDSTGVVPAGAAYRMDENLTVYSDVTGGCERILRTPIPLSYTRHTSRFMMIWLTLLPFTLWDSCGWAMLPITGIVSFLLLGIEEIGVSIEEPFTILPLEAIARTIEANLRELEATHGPATLGTKPEGALNATELLYDMIPSAAPKQKAQSFW